MKEALQLEPRKLVSRNKNSRISRGKPNFGIILTYVVTQKSKAKMNMRDNSDYEQNQIQEQGNKLSHKNLKL